VYATGLEEHLARPISALSKGFRQRVCLAQAILHKPRFLILDEPTSGLDPRGMVEVREIIRNLKKEHYTIFMSSHLLGEVQETCDRAALIDHGKLLVYDSIENLKGLTKVSKMEVTGMGQIDDGQMARIKSMPNVREVERVNTYTLLVSHEGAVDSRAELLTDIQALGVKVTGFSSVGLPLEMMYMDLVKESR
jgi:ABC-2 type transport system ATP-binding protein